MRDFFLEAVSQSVRLIPKRDTDILGVIFTLAGETTMSA